MNVQTSVKREFVNWEIPRILGSSRDLFRPITGERNFKYIINRGMQGEIVSWRSIMNSFAWNHGDSRHHSDVMDFSVDSPFPGHKFQRLVAFGRRISWEASCQLLYQDQGIAHW